jgi:hypothetical protein
MSNEEDEPQQQNVYEDVDEEAFLPEEEGEFSLHEAILSEIGATADESGLHLPDDVVACLLEMENEPDDVQVSNVGEDSLTLVLSIPHGDKTYKVQSDLSVKAMQEFDKLENYGFYLKVLGEDVLDEEIQNDVLDAADERIETFLRSCKQQGGRRRRRKTAKKNKKSAKKRNNKKRTYRKRK